MPKEDRKWYAKVEGEDIVLYDKSTDFRIVIIPQEQIPHGMTDVTDEDRLYSMLKLYHSDFLQLVERVL